MVTPASGSPSIPPDPKKRKVGSEPAASTNTQPLDAQINSVTLPVIQGPRSTNESSLVTRASDITASAAAVDSESLSVASMSMTEFVNSLNDEPLKTYKSLLKELVHHGVDFPFRPYREVLETTQKYLKHRADYSVSTTAQNLYKSMCEELEKKPEPGFSSTTKLLHELVYIYPGSSNTKKGDYEEKDPHKGVIYDLNKEFNPIQLRKGEDLVIFSFITQNDLDLMFFVNARSVPVYALGLAGGEDLHPSPYDEVKNPTRKDFLEHDMAHRATMEYRSKDDALGRVKCYVEHTEELEKVIKLNEKSTLESYGTIYGYDGEDSDTENLKKFLQETLKSRQCKHNVAQNLLASMHDKTPLIAHSLRLLRLKEKLLVAPQELQKPLQVLAFFIFHEGGSGGGYPFDPVFIAKRFLLILGTESSEEIDFSTKDFDEFGIRSFVDFCSKGLVEHFNEDFAYPLEYKTPEVISRLPQAADWMFNFLNEERLYQESEAGRREENSPEQQELYALMQKAVQKIKE